MELQRGGCDDAAPMWVRLDQWNACLQEDAVKVVKTTPAQIIEIARQRRLANIEEGFDSDDRSAVEA